MGVTRRRLLRAWLVVVAATPVAPWLVRRLPRRTVEGVRDVLYPYRVRPLDLEAVRRTAPWGG